MSLQIIKTGKNTWSLGHIRHGETRRDKRFSPVLTVWEAQVLFVMEQFEIARAKGLPPPQKLRPRPGRGERNLR